MHGGNAHQTACGGRQTGRRGRRLRTPRLLLRVWGEAFLQPYSFQHGYTAVQHLCGDAAAAAGPRASRRGHCGCGCGCGTVRAGLGWGSVRRACRGVGVGQGLGLGDGQRLQLKFYGLEAVGKL